MPKKEDVIKQLQAVLPKYTDYFSEKIQVSNVSYISGNTYQITTTTPHNLSNGLLINVEKILSKNKIITITNLGDGWIKFKTEVSHDLTKNFDQIKLENWTKQVYLQGFTNLADGYYDFTGDVPSKDEFTIILPVVPTGTGYLCEDRIDGINGRKAITLVDTTNFRIQGASNDFTSFALTTNSNITTDIRISGVGNPARFIQYYTKHSINKFWAFVSTGETNVSYSRNIESDANQRFKKGEDIQFECIQPIFVYVIAPDIDTYGGRYISDIMVDIRKYLCKALVGVSFPSGFDTEPDSFLTSFRSDDFFDYDGAYYIHLFMFETVFNFYSRDGIDPLNTRAFRRFEINYKLNFDNFDTIKTTIEGDLP